MTAEKPTERTLSIIRAGRITEAEPTEHTPGHLIAAAPDLLEACTGALDAIHFIREYVGKYLLPEIEGWAWYDATLALEAAIAKATGE